MLSKHEEQTERRDVIENEKRLRGSSSGQGSTFLSHTHTDIGGRFAAISSPHVVGEKQIPKYPAAFLQHDPVPDEPALGVDVNALEPCGEPHELKATLGRPSLSPVTKATSSASKAPLGAEGLSSRTYRRF
jgi:hypothetical protein